MCACLRTNACACISSLTYMWKPTNISEELVLSFYFVQVGPLISSDLLRTLGSLACKFPACRGARVQSGLHIQL